MIDPAITLHGTARSGHCHRVELLLRALDLPFRHAEASGATRSSPEYLALNPLGQVPVLQDGDVVLADSNAILVYLVRRYAPDSGWMPDEPVAAAGVQRWLSIAAGEVRYGPANARGIVQFGYPDDPAGAAATSARLLGFMEQHLAGRSYLAADGPTIADLACFSYVAHAPEGGISLEPYPAVRAWIGRIEAQPWFKPMPASPAIVTA
jgi:glutathione S-transferase